MAEESQAQAQPARQRSSSSEGKSGKSGPKRGPGLAPIQGDAADDPRPPHRQPGTREHLGEDPVYGGEPAPLGESDEDARNR